MRGKKRGLSLGSIMTIVLTVCVLIGCVLFFSAFRSGEDVVMTAQKMAGLIGDAVRKDASAEPSAQVRTVVVTLAPSLSTATPGPN